MAGGGRGDACVARTAGGADASAGAVAARSTDGAWPVGATPASPVFLPALSARSPDLVDLAGATPASPIVRAGTSQRSAGTRPPMYPLPDTPSNTVRRSAGEAAGEAGLAPTGT